MNPLKLQLVDVDKFTRHVTAMHDRVTHLLNEVHPTTTPVDHQASFIPTIYKELGVASEELQVAVEELERQNQALVEALAIARTEQQRYQELFASLPDAYVVTDEHGCIQEANRNAAQLLGVAEKFLVGKPLALFLKDLHQQSVLEQLFQQGKVYPPRTWRLHLEPRDRPPTTVTCVVTIHHFMNEITTFRWLIREIATCKDNGFAKHPEFTPETNSSALSLEGDLLQERIVSRYKPGDAIVIPPQSCCYLTQGLAKLITLTQNGEEVLLGILGAGMPFGGNLTDLSNYQAIAVSDVELVSLSTSEINSSPVLAQWFVNKVTRRLQHTETLLAIAGQRRVSDRLEQLLDFFRQEIGQTIPEGIRLRIRLTHEDLANACCTTRVTITRWLGKFHQQGRILFDRKYHIILVERSKGRRV
ncbi:MAG TPA: PAS domain-containing protein [Microcoleaceae cyanobacterium]|jgi:CRP-like cAMP-binding protein